MNGDVSFHRPRLKRQALRQSRSSMEHSVNVDLETPNTPGGDPNCLAHPRAGPHYDITVHPPGCPHHDRPRANSERRYWRDFATHAEAWQFADNIAAQPGAPIVRAVMVRPCRSKS